MPPVLNLLPTMGLLPQILSVPLSLRHECRAAGDGGPKSAALATLFDNLVNNVTPRLLAMATSAAGAEASRSTFVKKQVPLVLTCLALLCEVRMEQGHETRSTFPLEL